MLLLAMLCMCLTVVNGQHYKTAEPQILSGVDLLMGNTEGKSAGTPHPLVIGTLICGIWGLLTALVAPDKFLHSILSAIFLVICVALLRFDITYQAKAE
ncbi:MAG: hypothetical protein ACI4L8_09650, partial [Candidatus Fimadaptatus sp.]